MSKTHLTEDHLFQDLMSYQRVCAATEGRSNPVDRPQKDSKPTSQAPGEATKQEAKPSVQTQPFRRCYNCYSSRHATEVCRKPRREPGSCFQCGEKGHQVKDCPQRKVPSNPVALVENRSSPFVPAYHIEVEFPKLCFSIQSCFATFK